METGGLPGGVGPFPSESAPFPSEPARIPSMIPEVEMISPPCIPEPRLSSGDTLGKTCVSGDPDLDRLLCGSTGDEQHSPRQSSSQQQHSPRQSSSHPQHPLVCWFEQEVRPELSAIHRKLDLLTNNPGPRASGCARAGSRRTTKRATTLSSHAGFNNVLPRYQRSYSETSTEGPGAHKFDGGGHRSSSSLPADPAQQQPPGGPLAMILSQSPHGKQKVSVSKLVSEVLTEDVDDEPKRTTTSEELAAAHVPHPRAHAGQRRFSAEDFKMAEQAVIINSHHRRQFEMMEWIWAFLEDPDSSWPAKIFAMIQPWLITATVLLTLAQTPLPPLISGLPAATLEILCDALFLTEFLLRTAACPSPKVYFCSFYALIDLLASCPLPLRLAVGPVCPEGVVETVPHALLLFAVPIIRLLKTLRRFQKLHLLLKAFNLAAEALPVLLFILFTIALFFSVLIYLAEKENMGSLPKAFWFTIVTMTTVGYGDMYPTTDTGIVITGGLIIITVLYMAIPLGIVGEAFAQTWQDRDRILLMQRTRERLRQWGYTASDIPVLFRLSDGNDDGALCLTEFRQLLLRMHIGFSDERVMKLFQSLDTAQNGTIDDRAFVRGLFPEAYHEIFDEEDMATNCIEGSTIQTPPRSSRAERRSKHERDSGSEGHMLFR